jgi:FixJ family two-component response regulator
MDHAAPAKATIHIVEDDASVRTALARLLRSAGYETCVYASASELLLAGTGLGPGCMLLDVNLPGVSGLDLHAALAGRPDALPVVFITGRGDIAMGVRAIKAGAVDFLTKPVKREHLLDAIATAVRRDAETRARRANLAALRLRYETLTMRERDVFTRIVAGQLNKIVAHEIGTSLRTVKAHRAHVMVKLQASSIVDLVRIAEALGPPQP